MTSVEDRHAAGPLYVQAFLGIVGPDADSAFADLSTRSPFGTYRELSSRYYRLRHWGATRSTISPEPSGEGTILFKGRPFSLSPNTNSLQDTYDPSDVPTLESLLKKLDGKWSFCIASEHSIVCATDFIGAGSIFFTTVKDSCCFSTHLGLLRQVARDVEFDQVGITSLLLSNASICGLTPFSNVRRLEACSYLRVGIDAETLRTTSPDIKIYCDQEAELEGDTALTDEEDRCEAFERLLCESLDRENYCGDVALMLSGGHDSHAIALALCANFGVNRQPAAITYGPEGSLDLELARVRAAQLSFDHHSAPYASWDISTYADSIIRLNGGMSGLQTSHVLPGYEFAGSQGFQTTIVGYLGGPLTGSHIASDGRFDVRMQIHRQLLFRRYLDVALDKLYPQELDELKNYINMLCERLHAKHPHQVSFILDFNVRQASWMSLTFDLAESFVATSTPFYYRPLIRFMYNLPFESLFKQKLYKTCIQRMRKRVEGTTHLEGENQVWQGWSARQQSESPPPYTVDWLQVIQKSHAWLSTSIDENCKDSRLLDVCNRSIEIAGGRRLWSHPSVLLALAIAMGGKGLSEQA